MVPRDSIRVDPLELQSHLGENPSKFQVVCPQNGTAVIEGLTETLPCSVVTFVYYCHPQLYYHSVPQYNQLFSINFHCKWCLYFGTERVHE